MWDKNNSKCLMLPVSVTKIINFKLNLNFFMYPREIPSHKISSFFRFFSGHTLPFWNRKYKSEQHIYKLKKYIKWFFSLNFRKGRFLVTTISVAWLIIKNINDPDFKKPKIHLISSFIFHIYVHAPCRSCSSNNCLIFESVLRKGYLL